MTHNLQAATESLPPAKRKRTQFGFKELASGINPDVDIVAIHGIDGDPDGSWTDENGVLWLRDLLPAEIPNARILTYGYDANTHGQDRLATDFMHDHAMNFVSKLTLLREISDTVERPIIFVAHSSGGLLLKSALIHSHLCNDSHLKNHRAISRTTHGVAFFGTPHLGSATAELARSILDSESLSTPTSTVLIRHLERDSEALQHQLMQYSSISGQFQTKFFYEIYDTHFAGVSKRMIPRTSAVVPGAVNAEAIGIHKDHVHMVKFASVEDEDFRTVSRSLSLMSKAACQKMAEKEVRHESTVKLDSSIALESGVRIVTENVAKVEHDVKAVTEDVAKIGQDINRLVRAELPRAVEARFDMSNRQRCLKGTRVELLDIVRRWALQNNSLDSENSAFLFWLCGQAGTGKTTICSSVADTCHADGQLGASFFFSRDREDRNNIRLLFPTIAYQLGNFCKEFEGLVTEIFRNDPDVVHSDAASQLEKLIVNPLKHCASFPSGTVIVLDALDECKDQNPISTLLSIISTNRHRLTRLKFFITSRPEDNVCLGFRPLRAITQSLILHNIDTTVVNADIEFYLRKEFLTVSSIYPYLVERDWPPEEAIASLVQKSSRLFIFAATAIKFILDRSYRNPIRQLKVLLGDSQGIQSPSSPFHYLDQLYLKVLRQAFPETTDFSCFDVLKMIIGSIVLLRNPLSPGDLEDLLGLDDGVIRTTLSCLHSIIVVPDTNENAIRLIHPSFFDFITRRCADPQFRINASSHHDQLATFCFEQMKRLKRNICEIKDASMLNVEIQDLPERIKQHIPPALRYACLHWVFHLCGAGGTPSLQTSLTAFCHEKLLYWIEALSLFGSGSLRDGIRHITTLQTHLTNYSALPTELLTLLKDAQVFTTEYFNVISPASLQLYRSALPLSPSSNSLRRAFSHELSGGVRVLQRAREVHHSGLTVLRGPSSDNVHSAEFSPDGTLVVSNIYGDVCLWDRGTGTLLKTLRMDRSTSSVKFFQDGERLISVSEGGIHSSICIWDATSGTSLRTTKLEALSSGYHFTWSPDSTRIARSPGSEVMILDVSNGSLLNILKGHEKDVHCHAFSPNRMLIASGSKDRTIRIWDIVSGVSLKTFMGHFDSIWSLSFSPCNKYLVSGSADNDLRLWDISHGVTSKIFEGHSGWVLSVAFSPNGAQIISGSRDGELRVWSVVDGELLKTLRLGDHAVKNVGFSFDGSYYIWTWDMSIYIWDADQASDLDQSEEPRAFLDITFSTDGTLLVAPNGRDIYIWDGLTGDPLKVLKGQSGYLDRPVFSPNNQYVAFNALSVIYLWDISSPTVPRTLWAPCTFSSFTFSPDSTRIVSVSSAGRSVRIWNTANGNHIFCIEARHSFAYFSPDGSQIIADTYYRYDIPPPFRCHPVPLNNSVAGQLQYSIDREWVLGSRGDKKERCIWLPAYWRIHNTVSSRGRVAIGTHHGLVILDLSDISLSI